MAKKDNAGKNTGGSQKKIWKKWWFWVLFVSVLIGGVIRYTEPETEENTVATTEVTEPIVTKEPETKKSELAEEPETKKNDTEKIKDVSAYELITMKGHPVLYDYLSVAHTFWDDYADGRIDFGDDVFYNFETGKTVLSIETYLVLEHALDEHMIRRFNIYPNKELSLSEGLDIAKSYLPLDILKEWYTLV